MTPARTLPPPDAAQGGPVDEDLSRAVTPTLERLQVAVAGIRGVLVASVDGRPLAAVLPQHDQDSTAAIVAASLALSHRLADLTGHGDLQELVVRSASGYVVVYALGDRGVLTVLTTRSSNLALVHLKAREAVGELAHTIDEAVGPRSRTSPTGGTSP